MYGIRGHRYTDENKEDYKKYLLDNQIDIEHLKNSGLLG